MSNGKNVGLKRGDGVKFCKKCKRQGKIVDTRFGNDFVRRRYRCICKLRWTSIEHRAWEAGGTGRNTEKQFLDTIKKKLRVEMQKELRGILGLP